MQLFLQFNVGDNVFLMNPRVVRQKMASRTISGVAGEHKFHFKDIPKLWWKVDVHVIMHTGVALMYPNDDADMTLIEHAKGSAAMWHQNHIKLVI